MQRLDRTHPHIQTLILAGGAGERLRPLTRGRAKPLVPFGDRFRLIDFTLSNCFNSGLRRAYLLTQYDAQSICSYAHLIDWFDELRCLAPRSDQSYCGTADAVRRNAITLMNEPCEDVLLLSADHIYKMDYRKLIRFHRNSGNDVTVACAEHPAALASGFGVMEVDHADRITGFSEKPAHPRTLPDDPSKSLVSMGVYVFKKDALWDALSEGGSDFGREILPRLVSGRRACGYNFSASQPGFAYWRDVGTLDTYYQTQMEVLQISSLMSLDPTHGWPIYSALHAPAPVPETPDRAASVISPDAFVAPTAKVTRSIVMEGARIGSDSRVQRAIIMEGVSIPPKTEIGFDKQADGSRFQITPKGVIIVDPDSARRLSNDSQRHLSLAYAG